MAENATRDFFISYTGVNESWAKWIAVTLEQVGYTTLVQAFDFRPGNDFIHKMHEATSNTKRTIAVLSPAYFGSQFGEAEWRVAFAKDPSGERGLLVPVRVQLCQPPGLLAGRVYIDLVDVEEVTARERLVEGVKVEDVKVAGAHPSTAVYPGGPAVKVTAAGRFPGPEVSNLPARPRGFIGRDEDLERLHADLLAGTAAGELPIQAVHGLGGVGKTTLALEYAHRFASDYELIWWVDAEQPTTAIAALARLATQLGVPEVSDQAEMITALFNRLRRRGRWLLIYDNAERPDQLARLLPPEGMGHVLVTSRWATWGAQAATQRLATLPRTKSVQFLRRRIGTDDPAALDALAELVGDLPLALEEAAAYLEETQDDLGNYLQLVRDRARELFGQEPDAEDEAGDRRRVATVWTVSLDRVHADVPAAGALLNLYAFLAPDVPRRLPTEHPDVLPAELAAVVRDPLRYNRTLAAIGRYSLATLSPASVGLHRLVQTVIRARLTDEDERTWTERALRLLWQSFPLDSEEISSWPRCQELLPHWLVVCEHAERLQVGGKKTGWLLDQAATYLRSRGQYRQAQPLAERALQIGEATLGPDSPYVGMLRSNLGRVLRDLGDLPGARTQLERALQIGESTLGPDSPSVGSYRSNLGSVLRELGDLPGARTQLERALQITEAARGPDHRYVGTLRSNLGRVLQELGDLPGARTELERALQIGESTSGPDHPTLGTYRSNLGLVLRDLGDLPGARTQLERALQITEATLGPDHPTVGTYRSNLGSVLQELGDLPGARTQLERALQDTEATLGPDHPRLALYFYRLGRVCADLGDLAAAVVALTRAVQVDTAAYGPDHPKVATDLKALAAVQEQQGDTAAAAASRREAERIRQLH
ncbi:FxSxx-COOH system tetratricopeptide repeat protein [Geodermatophilus sp. URMC 62]|uniref:FxSxx-COOH system tetratricopeptide repeat protein n=1 Tax=Geodermatophilus sp. URMC 62 TaxID=3423414 RepID=UPI00406C8905